MTSAEIPAGSTPFTLYKRDGFHQLVLMLGLVLLLEIAPVHVLLARWSVPAAWVMTGLSAYGAVWAWFLYRSFALRPGLIGNGELLIRFGLLFSIRVPFESIRRMGSEPVPGAVLIPRKATPNLYIEFTRPLILESILGLTRPVSAVGIALDDGLSLEPYINHLPRE